MDLQNGSVLNVRYKREQSKNFSVTELRSGVVIGAVAGNPAACHRKPEMISVVIPTLDAEAGLPTCMTALVPAVVEGVVSEVIIVDGGSQDRTLEIADEAGANIIKSDRGRGLQLREGGRWARGEWILFLHADTVLEPGWWVSAKKFMDRVGTDDRSPSAGVFRFALDDDGVWPRVVESAVGFRARILGLPYGDQGLLIQRTLYDDIGGYRALRIMEDVDIVRRLGRRRLTLLDARGVTSAARYRRDGYFRRVLRNQACMMLYYCGASDERIARAYGLK